MVGADLSLASSFVILISLSCEMGRRTDMLRILLEWTTSIKLMLMQNRHLARKQVKTVTYALLYGAGDEKDWSIHTMHSLSIIRRKAKREKKSVAQVRFRRLSGLGELLDRCWLKLRKEGSSSLSMVEKLRLIRPHKALNYLLQSGAGVIAKRWMCHQPTDST